MGISRGGRRRKVWTTEAPWPAPQASGSARQAALKKLATQLSAEAAKSSDQPKVRMLTDAVRELAAGK